MSDGQQSVFPGPREQMDAVFRAFEKPYESRFALSEWFQRHQTA